MRKLSIVVFIIFVFISIFSLLSTKIVYKASAQDSSQKIIITEIAAHEPSNLEWIEIYNTTNQELDISTLIFYENETNHSVTSNGFLPANTYAIIANKADELNFKNIDLIYDSSWSSLNQSGENLQLILNDVVQDSITYDAFTQDTSLERLHINQSYSDQWQHHPVSNSALEINHNQIQEQEICTLEAVTETIIEYQESPVILLSEINLKNSEQDWIEIFIDPKQQELNLEKYSITIDNSSTTLPEQTISEPQLLTINTTLVGTTEQVLITKDDLIIDAFCWINSSPTESEQAELQELLNADLWQDDCANSEDIQNNQSYSRSNFFIDTNSLQDWTLDYRSTKSEVNTFQNQAPTAKITIQSGKTVNEEKVTLNLDGSESFDPDQDNLSYNWDLSDGETSDKANPASITFTEEGTHQITLTVTDTYNFSSSASIYIEVLPKTEKISVTANTSTTNTASSNTETETKTLDFIDGKISLHSFFPNPEGSDQGQEWIKLINNDSFNINLENWVLDDSAESGSKPYTITNIELAPNETYTFSDSITGLVLNNSNDSVRLIKPDQSIKEQTNYTDSKDNEIFSKTNDQWTRSIPNQSSSELVTINSISNTNSKSKLNATNGTKNSELQITEVFPNPKGTDTGNEWIELYNPSTETTHLSNWKLKYNSKEQILGNEEVPAQSYKQIQILSSALPNKETNLALLDFEDNIISQVSYQDSKEGESYSNISGEWIWTDIITPNQANPEILELEGIITNINPENQTLTLSSEAGSDSKILFKSANLDSQIDLESKYKAKLKAFSYNSTLLLTEFVTIEKIPTATSSTSELPLLIALSILAIISIIFKNKIISFLKQHQIWHNTENLSPENVQQKAS
jgi:hypothetical protein